MARLTPSGDDRLGSLKGTLGAGRAYVTGAIVFSALVNLLYLAPTLYMMQVYDRIIPTGSLTTLWLISIAAMAALAVLAALDNIRSRLMIRASLGLDRRLSASIFARAMEPGSKRSVGQVLRDLDHLKSALSGSAAVAMFDAPWTPIYLIACFLLHPAIGVLTMVGGGLLLGLAILNERSTRPKLARASQQSVQAYAAHEAMTGPQAEVVRAIGMRKAVIDQQIRQRANGADLAALAQLDGGIYSGLIKFLRLLLQSVALGLAAFLAIGGQLSPGAIIAASVLLSRAVAPIETLVGAWPAITQARTSWTALKALYAETADPDRPRTSLPRPQGRLELENVIVRLGPDAPPQLKGVSLRLDAGQTLGVIGPSGGGKTTLARVIAGALAPGVGVVRLDGADFAAWSSDDLARHIGYVPQVPSLMAGSIKDNISRFDSHITDDIGKVDAATVAAAISAGAHEMILRLPHGYDTVLGPQGAGVSTGQAQRIALARALYGDPVLLVLDEPNSNLDQEGEAALMKATVEAAARGAAVVIIAHRAGVLSEVDRLLTLKDGSVQLDGPRQDVLARIRSAVPPVGVRPQ